ncbi:DUF485 domain-containing protein [Burkholderia cenocepacia]|uniref:DUF485 domain-containing protein n=1 Tax=Burkholderia cenocepacia TaxID=95486 RepID=UPI0004F81DF6|nr:DUF485 domain-containing protein [Burkholderia cenocepacia]AIO43476.1 hypothetical protein DM42_6493 [Burkholderia cepacia]KGC04938.1 hypothetical protein DM44_7049 [Burkholderia cepacia]MCG0577985.1 DUF485 domain-containing protein [Burkholderia cenocepacia]MCW3524443.1 DUF485 domain-containing protein [Burkholderia cenocepacia]MCW3614665.1 DUF485 domain-containing protein [Burkholderia cenocepacia]
MDTTAHSWVAMAPLFDNLVRRRRRFVASLTALTIIPYYAFILIATYAPHLLAVKVASTSIVSIGWVIGVALIVGTWLLTGLYVRRANGEFDGMTQRLLAGEQE